MSPKGEGGGEGEAQAEANAPATLDNPLYRRVFVGREPELRQVQTAYDNAMSGQGSLVMVVGEPGIGKTSVCEQLATYATLRGGITLTGHCYEEGSLSLPYLAFVEALRSYVQSRPPEALRQELGAAAPDLARIVSEVRERLAIEPRPPSEPEEDRWRLLEAVSGFLRNASLVQPLVIVLEDLHWADQGTLDLLTHFSRNLQGARLRVIGTYRDVEVDRSHPLSAALAEAIHRQTEGNPLFVQEVVRYLVEEGHLGQGGAAGTGAAATMTIPEGLRDVIGRRIAHLSPECNRLLAIAAVIGRDFSLATLQTVSGNSGDEAGDRLGEAVRTAVLSEQERLGEVQYRFAHAFFRQTLYEELGAARRIQFHQQVARALESQYAGRLEEHAAELAEHFSHSSDRADLAKAVQYAELAAGRAMGVYAYGEAVRHLEQALDVQEVLDPDDRAKRCDLLLALCEAMLPAEDPARVASGPAEQAFALAESLGDSDRAARVAVVALEALERQQPISAARDLKPVQPWVERADRYAAEGTRERIRADTYIGNYRIASTGPASGHPYLRKAAEAAGGGVGERRPGCVLQGNRPGAEQSAGRPGSRPRASNRGRGPASAASGGPVGGPGPMPDVPGVCAAGAGRPYSGGSGLGGDAGPGRADAGRGPAGAGSTTRRCAGLSRWPARRTALPPGPGRSAGCGAGHHSHRSPIALPTPPGRLQSLVYRGHDQEVLVQPWVANPTSRAAFALASWCLAQLGRHEQARALRQRFGDLSAAADETASMMLAWLLESAVLGADLETATALERRLAGMARFPCVVTLNLSWPRILGAAAALLGERERARAYYEQALEVCGRLRFRPELALTHLGIAELLLGESVRGRASGVREGTGASLSLAGEGQGEGETRAPASTRGEALRHLDIAIAELRAMKMQPALERALRHKDVLKA